MDGKGWRDKGCIAAFDEFVRCESQYDDWINWYEPFDGVCRDECASLNEIVKPIHQAVNKCAMPFFLQKRLFCYWTYYLECGQCWASRKTSCAWNLNLQQTTEFNIRATKAKNNSVNETMETMGWQNSTRSGKMTLLREKEKPCSKDVWNQRKPDSRNMRANFSSSPSRGSNLMLNW